MKQSTKQLTVSALLFALGLVLPFFDRTGSADWQHAAAHALSRFSLCLSLRLAICAVFRLSAAHLPQHDFRHAPYVPRCHCHGI